MSNSEGLGICGIGFLIGLFFGLFVSGTQWHKDKIEFNKQAIERGYAEYKTDSDGVTVFTWKDAK